MKNPNESASLACIAMILLVLLVINLFVPLSFAHALTTNDALMLSVNFDRIRTQLDLSEKSYSAGNITMAFGHAYLIHSKTLPAIDNYLNETDPTTHKILEARLANLVTNMHNQVMPADDAREEISRIKSILATYTAPVSTVVNSNKTMLAYRVIYLLNDTDHYYRDYAYYHGRFPNCTYQEAYGFYQLGNADASQLNYESAVGFAGTAHTIYEQMSGFFERDRSAEIESFFVDLQDSIDRHANSIIVDKWVQAIQRDILEELESTDSSSDKVGLATYFANIRQLLNSTVIASSDKQYDQAESDVVNAYLNNYEYLEGPIEKHDPKLMSEIEISMREELRTLIKSNASPDVIENKVGSILANLEIAENLIRDDPDYTLGHSISGSEKTQTPESSFANINDLSKGFGAYTGPRKQIGDADELTQANLRKDVDDIKQSLAAVLSLYKQSDKEDAFLVAQSAYLDSYENVEVPLRPIDPDFTLEMEIGFAKLRNLIQSDAPYAMLEAQVVEIRNGLDESERLVSGTGTLAPAIAFSTSFSITFREGLEAALIMGTIISYLDASRNPRFKKHVYVGILIAVAATAITWFITGYIISVSGASLEMIQAIAAVSAVGVMFWVTFWILNKLDTKRWVEFVDAKVWRATTTGSVTVFITLSFFIVYREGFALTLFSQAMLTFAKYMEIYVMLGLISGIGTVLVTYLGVKRLGRKIPLRTLFCITIGVGGYMSIAFIGDAVRELQVVDYLPATNLVGIVPRLDISLASMTGIHPTLETIVAQVSLLIVYLAGSTYLLVYQPALRKKVEISRKTYSDFRKKQDDGNQSPK